MKTNWLILSIMFGTVLFMYPYVMIESNIQHEKVHEAIAKNHKCVDGTIEHKLEGLYFIGTFKCNQYLSRSDEMIQQEKMLHSMNEIVSYNKTAIINSIFTLVLVMVIGITIYVMGEEK